MRNPLKDEETAFHFVLGSVLYFGLIVLASWIATLLGVVVFVALTIVALARLRGGKRPPAMQLHVARAAVDDTRRIVVVANETVRSLRLKEEVLRMADGFAAELLVVCPALNSQLRTWLSDEDDARQKAASRLEATVEDMRAAGFIVRGEIGDGDPIQALEDALRGFGADAILISTHAPGHSNWLEQRVVENARARFDIPVTHVVGDAEAIT